MYVKGTAEREYSLRRPFLSVKSYSLCCPQLYDQRHNLPPPHIDDAFIRQLDIGADGECECRKRHDGIIMPIAVFREGAAHVRDLLAEDGERAVREDARDGERCTRSDASVPYSGNTALHVDDGVCCRRHIRRGLSEDKQVVAVVRIGGRRRAARERCPADERHAAAAIFAVPLKDTGKVVGAALPVDHAAAHGQFCPSLCDKGRMLLHLEDAAEHRPLRDRRTQDEVLGTARRQMHAAVKMRGERRVPFRLLPRLAARKDLPSRTPDVRDLECPQIGEHDEVGDAAGCNCPLIPEPHMLCGRIGRRIDRLLGRKPELHAPPNEMVQLSAPHEVVGHCIIRNEGKTPRQTVLHEVVEELFLQGLFLQLDEHSICGALCEPLKRLIRMIGADAAAEELRQLPSDEARAVPLDGEIRPAVLNLADQTIRLGVRICNDLAAVHHLAEADHLIHVHERLDIIILDRGTRRLERVIRRRNGRGDGDANVAGAVLRTLHQRADARETEYICDLMRLRDERRHAAAYRAVHKRTRRTHRTFNVHMAVDQPRDDILPRKINRTPRRQRQFVHADIGEAIAADGNIARNDFFEIAVVYLSISQKYVNIHTLLLFYPCNGVEIIREQEGKQIVSLVQLCRTPHGKLDDDERDKGDGDAVRDVERERGERNAEKCRDILGDIRIVKIAHPRHHADTDIDENRCRRRCRNHQCERRHREDEEECDGRRARRQSRAAARLDPRAGLEIGNEHGDRKERADRRGDGVHVKDLVKPRQIAIFVEETCLAPDADRRAEAREEVRQEERKEERQIREIERTTKVKVEENGGDAVRYTEDALWELGDAHGDTDHRSRENTDERSTAHLTCRENQQDDERDRREEDNRLCEIAERERDLLRICCEQLCIAHPDNREEDAHTRTDRDLYAARDCHDNSLAYAKHCHDDKKQAAEENDGTRHTDRHILQLHHRDRKDRDTAHAGREGKGAVRIQPHRHRRSEDHEHHAREHRPRRNAGLPHHVRDNGEHIAHRCERREPCDDLRRNCCVILLQPKLPLKE